MYSFYQIDKTNGALVVVRPDGYNAQITELSASGVKQIASYFVNILVSQN